MTASAPIRQISTALARVNAPLAIAARNLAGGFLIIMTIVVMMQVVARYGLNNSLSWSEQLSKTLMVWSAFLVAPWAYREGANVAIELFADAFPKKLRIASQLIISMLVLWITAIFFVESLAFVERGMSARAAALPVSTGVLYMITPVAFAMLFLAALEGLFSQAADMIDPTQSAPLENTASGSDA